MHPVLNETNLLLYPNIKLLKEEGEHRPLLMLHPETKEPFTGVSTEAFRFDDGGSTIHYITYLDGMRNGQEVVTDVQGFVRYRAYWKNNRLHGPKFAKHDNGVYREKSLWDSSDPERPNRLLELTIWRYNGQRCPYSGIDADGFGQKYLWPEHGNTPLLIDFYYNHIHSSTLFLKDDGRFKEGWVGNYPKIFYYLELLG